MVTNINPNATGPSASRVATGPRRARQESESAFAPPPSRADINFIPSTESLATLIQSAIAALRQGVYWDRGTILNLIA